MSQEIKNTIKAIFGTEDVDANITELLNKIIANRELAKQAIKNTDYNQLTDIFPRLSILNSELADIVSMQHITTNTLHAGFEAEKENIYREQIAGGSSMSGAYQHSSRMVKRMESKYINEKGILASLVTFTESIRYLISDIKARLEYEKGAIMQNNNYNNTRVKLDYKGDKNGK